jgi:hypothetical protein
MKQAFPVGALTPCGIACVVAAPPAASHQSQSNSGLRKEVKDLKGEGKGLQSELDQIKAALRLLNTPRNPRFDINGAPSMGDAKAKVLLIEFCDRQCPFSMSYVDYAYRRVIADYVKPGKVR